MPPSVDIITPQDEFRLHCWDICLWPKRWKTSSVSLNWHIVALDDDGRSKVPKTTGIYSLVIQPEIAGHSGCSYLMYVGQATDLRRRFSDYLTTEREKRPKIVRLLRRYHGHISFFYSMVDKKTLDNTEDELINAFIPPCNSRFKGEVQQGYGAFQ